MGNLTMWFEGADQPKLVRSEFEDQAVLCDKTGKSLGKPQVAYEVDFQWRKGPQALTVFLVKAVLWWRREHEQGKRFLFKEAPAVTLHETLRRRDRLAGSRKNSWPTVFFGYDTHANPLILRIVDVSMPGGQSTAEFLFEVLHPKNTRVIWKGNGEDISKDEAKLGRLAKELTRQYNPDAPEDDEADGNTPHASLPTELRSRLESTRGPVEFLVPPGFDLEDLLDELKRQCADSVAFVDVHADGAGSQVALWTTTYERLHSALGISMPALPSDLEDGYLIWDRIRDLLEADHKPRPVVLFRGLDQLVLNWQSQNHLAHVIKTFYIRFYKLRGVFAFGTVGLEPILIHAFSDRSTVDFSVAPFDLCEQWDAWVEDRLGRLVTRPAADGIATLLKVSERHPKAFRSGLEELCAGRLEGMAEAVKRVHAAMADSILNALPGTMQTCLINGAWDRSDQDHITHPLCDAHILRKSTKSSGRRGPSNVSYEPLVSAWKDAWAKRRSSR